MSLGLEFDFLAVIGLVKQISKSFIGAPEQFKAISDDVRGFSIVLQDIEANCTDLSPEHSQEYQSVVTSCKHLLVRLKRTLEEYSEVAKDDKTGKRTAIKRVWKRLKWEPDDIRDIRSQISVKIGTLRSLNDQVTSHNIVKLIRHQEDTEREATIKWVSDINYVAQQNDIFLRCQTGSRKWLFESEAYLEWLRQKGSLLFCPGNPGTGKTFTTAMVVESLRLANDAETLTTYMYCSYQNHTQTIEKLLCSLLRVAFEEADSEADGAISTCKQLRLSNKSISRQHCLTLLQDLFSRFARVNLIVDAIDELTNEVRRPLIYDLLKLHGHSDVSLFVTSRGIPEIQRLFETCKAYTSLEVRSSDEDIRNFLRDNIFQLPNFVARSPKLQNEVINSVTNASAGMFLLAELYLKSLANIISVGSLRTRVSNLTTGSNAYDSLYEDSMLRIGFQGPELERIAIQMLLVLTCARRPLSPQELSHALSIDETSDAFDEEMVPDMDDLVAACTGLAVLDDTSNVVHLVHKSAAEYFERSRSRWFPKANEKMAFMCLRYLQIAETEPEETRGEEAPFFHYAKANWCYHSMESEKEAAMMSDASRTESTSDSSSLPNRLAVTQLSIQQMTKEVVDVDSSIVEACHAGHQAWVEQLLVVRNYDMNIHGIRQEKFISDRGISRDTVFSTTPSKDDVLLTIAAARGDDGMVLMLLAHGADPNIFNAMGQTPLAIAVERGDQTVAQLLLTYKADPNIFNTMEKTLLAIAVEQGDQKTAQLLLEHEADPNLFNAMDKPLLAIAVERGDQSMTQLLLEHNADPNLFNTTCMEKTPLATAVEQNDQSMIQLLLEYKADPNIFNTTEKTPPLTIAVKQGDQNITQLLLVYGADPNISNTIEKIPPLTIAVERRDQNMTRLLLEHGGDPNIFNANGQTPLFIAAMNGFDNLVSLLLDQNLIEPDLMCQHSYGLSTAFLTSIELGQEGCFRMLLERSDRRARDSQKRGAMWLAASSGHIGIISELLKCSDMEIDYADTDCGSPLTAAVRGDHEDAALLLMPYLELRSCNYCGVTQIHNAVRHRLYNLLEWLLKHDASAVDSELFTHPHECRHLMVDCGQYGIERVRTPLTTAIYLRDAQATQILLPYANPNQGLNTWRPLHGAAEWGNAEIFELLLKKEGIELDPVDEHGRTPFLLAAERGHCDIMNTLLQKERIQLDIRNGHGETPFFLMAEHGNSDMMNKLIQKGGIQLDIGNEHGKTPFFLMAEHGNCDTINALIKLADVQLDGRDTLRYVADHYLNNHLGNIYEDCYHILTSILDKDVNKKDLDGSSFLHRACSLRPKISMKNDTGTQIFEAKLLETNSGHLVTELLKRPGIDVNLLDEDGNTPLLLAVKNHQQDVVRLLLEREDTDVFIRGEEWSDALLLASAYRPMFTQLFSKSASSMKADIRPLSGQVPSRYRVDHWPEILNTEFKGYAESIFSMLLHDKRRDYNTSFRGRGTYLYPKRDELHRIMRRVAEAGTKGMIQAALEVTKLASELKTILHDDGSLIVWALMDNEDDEAVGLLIALCSSAVLQKADTKGRTPLSYAAERATSRVARSLLEAGVNTNTVDEFGKTPLSYAAEKGHPDTARLLLAADETLLSIQDCKGSTPLMHASYELNINVMSVFLETPSVDILALDGEGHSFLCHLMMPRYFCIDGYMYGLEKALLDGVIRRIHHLLQPNVGAIRGYIHSPFLCALEKQKRSYGTLGRKPRITSQKSEEIFWFMNNLQRYTILSDFFHPGLDFSRCATTDGVLEILGEKKRGVEYDVYDHSCLCIRALRRYVKKDN
ncbi:hypothetical protein N5P37_011939 [Trichoderma harzianum]|nr:hypothetical protein N5P37_011939 [Trichoderma harzianum]